MCNNINTKHLPNTRKNYGGRDYKTCLQNHFLFCSHKQTDMLKTIPAFTAAADDSERQWTLQRTRSVQGVTGKQRIACHLSNTMQWIEHRAITWTIGIKKRPYMLTQHIKSQQLLTSDRGSRYSSTPYWVKARTGWTGQRDSWCAVQWANQKKTNAKIQNAKNPLLTKHQLKDWRTFGN